VKIAITGATGFVGTRLVSKLTTAGHEIIVFTRDEKRGRRVFPPSAFPNLEIVAYQPTKSGDWQQAMAKCDAVVNLAGQPIAEERWTPQIKEKILHSRQGVTEKIVEAIALANPKPKVLINASAIGYYGTSETATFTETSPPGDDFLAQVCQKWEAAATKVTAESVRLVILRIGIVLGKNGGALSKMLPVFKLFAGGPLGNGKQWFSWIHRDDLVSLIIAALEQEDKRGTFNATAPNPVRMNELCQTLGAIMKRPSWLPVPSFALEMLLGDGAKVVLEGQQVLPQQTLAAGFLYQYPTIQAALKEILS